MRSIEISCLIIALTALLVASSYLMNYQPDISQIAKQLTIEINSISGAVNIDIGIPAIIEIQNNTLIIHYQGHIVKSKLKIKTIDSIDYGPVIAINYNGTHVWLRYKVQSKRMAPKIKYTIYNATYWKSLIKELIEISEPGFILGKIGSRPPKYHEYISQNEYELLNFDAIIYSKAHFFLRFIT